MRAALGRSAEHASPRRARSCPARGAASRRRRELAERRACRRRPARAAGARRRGRASRRWSRPRRPARTRRPAPPARSASIASRSARASRRTGARHRPAACGQQLGAHQPQAEVVRRDERLDAPAPALAQRVDEVDRGAPAEPVPPRRAARERQRELVGEVAGGPGECITTSYGSTGYAACRGSRATRLPRHVRPPLPPGDRARRARPRRRAVRPRAGAGVARPHRRRSTPSSTRSSTSSPTTRWPRPTRSAPATSARSPACRSPSRTTAPSRASA